jgi:hypothetical protein
MNTDELKRLSIGYLRGSVELFSLLFEKGKKLTIVYGENATGKSTICDAFEFLGKGKVGSLENRGLGRSFPYWPSIGKKQSDVFVSLETSTAICKATIGTSDVVVKPPEHRPRVEVFRRKHILALVEAPPGKRYEEVSRFIDVSGVEDSEASLRQLTRDLSESQQVAIARVQENEEAIRHFWSTADKPQADPIAWARSESLRKSDAFDAEIVALEVLLTSFNRLGESSKKLDEANSGLLLARNAELAAKKYEEECLHNISKEAVEVVAVLKAAQDYLRKYPSPSLCPLCESAEKVSDLADRVGQRMNLFASFQDAQTKTKSAEQERQRSEQKLAILWDGMRRDAGDFEKAGTSDDLKKDIVLPLIRPPEDIAALPDWLSSNAHLPPEWKKAVAERYDKKSFVSTLQKSFKTWDENIEQQKWLARILPKMKKTLDIIAEERRIFTDGILLQIANEVGRLYDIVHPGEGLGSIRLFLDPEKRSSLEIDADFCGKRIFPQAYFSDSHLDTLGLCIFFALSALDQPEKTVLVLDDILGSVDEPHIERLIGMIYSEALKFKHCIITTHYRPWKYKLRWGWLQNGECQFIELAKWTSASGLSIVRSIPDVERLRLLVAENPPDLQLVCSKAGVILEASLDFITLLYECAVPRRQSESYTLGDLLPSIGRSLRQALKVEILAGRDTSGAPIFNAISLTPIIEELMKVAQARNIFGCHFNEISFEMLDADALRFAKLVLSLMDVLVDEKVGWPKNGKSGNYWATAGETRRLYPYKKPA